MTTVSGILLAGGASRRFGRPKVLEPVDGAPLFHAALRALSESCDEVVIVLARDAPGLPLPPTPTPVRFVRDEVAFEGPLYGALTGLRAVAGGYAVLAAADMPGLRPSLIRLMIEPAVADGSAVVLGESAGPRPLPAVLPTATARRLGEELVTKGERRLRALVDGLAPAVIPMETWATVDPDGAWRRDVDVPADLPRSGV